jgi:glucokinase
MSKQDDKIRRLSKRIARKLFTDGIGRVADRLVLEIFGKDGGGWCESAVIDQIEKVLRKSASDEQREAKGRKVKK